MKLTVKQKKAILAICMEYRPEGQRSVFVNLGNDIIEYLENQPL